MTIDHVIFAVLAVFVVLLALYINGFRNWLVYAVTDAETALGSKTGQLKLRWAYDLALSKYPILAKIMPYSLFDWFVGSALKVMRKMLENQSIAEIVEGAVKDEGK